MKKEKKQIKEYCPCCKKKVIPEKKFLTGGGYLYLCPVCGLSLSADILPTKTK